MPVDIVFLNSMRWGSPIPSAGQRLASGLAARHRLLYVEPAENILRYTPRRSRRRVAGQAHLQPCWRLPVHFARPVDPLITMLGRINAEVGARQVARGARAMDMHRPALCNALVPAVSASVCDRLRPSAVIYLATDPIEGMDPPLHVRALEEEWLRRADCIVCTSERLVERFSGRGQRVEFLPNGADVHLFEASSRAMPEAIRQLPRPRAVSAGTIDFRCDAEAIRAVADRMPVVVLGTATDMTVLRRLRAHRNVHYVGAVPHTAVPSYLGAADVLLMPYLDNLATRFMYPQKLHEYLATGRPVVASRVPALASFDGLLTLATTSEFGEAAVAAAARGADGAEARVATARANSWDQRVRRLEEIVDDLVSTA